MKRKSPKTKIPPAHPTRSVIDIPTDPDDGGRIVQLLRRFDAQQAGDTQEEAATRLAAMALTISNIAAGHLVVRVDHIETDMGIGFVVEGGLLTADFAMSVMEPALRLQQRLERTLLHDVEADATFSKGKQQPSKEAQQQRSLDNWLLPLPRAKTAFKIARGEMIAAKISSNPIPSSNSSGRSTASSSSTHATQSPSHSQDKSSGQKTALAKNLRDISESHIGFLLIGHRKETIYREMLDYPVCVTEVLGIHDLDTRSTRAHLGRVLAYARINSTEMLEKTARMLVESSGRRNVPHEDGSRTVRIDPVLCVRTGVIEQAMESGRGQPSMLKQMLWLVESTVGCELPDVSGPPEESACSMMDFPCVIKNEIMKRMHFRDDEFHDLPALKGMLGGWRDFLRERERHFPGIALAAGNLPQALCYGLASLRGKDMEVAGDEVIALAKWLVLRMVNRFADIEVVHTSNEIEGLADKIAGKLAENGPMTVRELVRRFYRLPSSKCQEALRLLEARNIAGVDDNVWGILGNSAEAMAFLSRPQEEH